MSNNNVAAEQVLSEKARQAQRAYKREWRAKNRDKVKASNNRYWEKKAKAMQEQEGGAQ